MPWLPHSGTVNSQYFFGYHYQEVYYLAKIIHAEARGESFEGMVAVGAVVLNRVESPGFPNSIEKVIYQPNQFSSLYDGQFELEPDDVAFSAAAKAIMGHDPTDGCLYFYNPSIATAAWSFQRQPETKIGNHVFTK
ncbi:cell wall hydrolase [Alkaliphilus crotonatoxidans]